MSEKRKIKFPATYKVRNKCIYEILQAHNLDEGKTYGECRPDPRQIVLEEEQPQKEKISTLVHELLHAITNEYDDITLTENEVRILEKALVYGFRKNRDLWLDMIKFV